MVWKCFVLLRFIICFCHISFPCTKIGLRFCEKWFSQRLPPCWWQSWSVKVALIISLILWTILVFCCCKPCVVVWFSNQILIFSRRFQSKAVPYMWWVTAGRMKRPKWIFRNNEFQTFFIVQTIKSITVAYMHKIRRDEVMYMIHGFRLQQKRIQNGEQENSKSNRPSDNKVIAIDVPIVDIYRKKMSVLESWWCSKYFFTFVIACACTAHIDQLYLNNNKIKTKTK